MNQCVQIFLGAIIIILTAHRQEVSQTTLICISTSLIVKVLMIKVLLKFSIMNVTVKGY